MIRSRAAILAATVLAAVALDSGPAVGPSNYRQQRERSPEEHARRIAAAEAKRQRKAAKRRAQQGDTNAK